MSVAQPAASSSSSGRPAVTSATGRPRSTPPGITERSSSHDTLLSAPAPGDPADAELHFRISELATRLDQLEAKLEPLQQKLARPGLVPLPSWLGWLLFLAALGLYWLGR